MTQVAGQDHCAIGVAGLNPAGRRLTRALLAKNLPTAVFDPAPETAAACETHGIRPAFASADGGEFLAGLSAPRTVILCGANTLGDGGAALLQKMEPGDLLIDASDDYFRNCIRRSFQAQQQNVRYLGLARMEANPAGGQGTLVIGGRIEIFHGALWLLEAMASSDEGEAGIFYAGAAGSEHFTQALTDGIEFALGRLVRETSGVLGAVLAVPEAKASDIHDLWQLGAMDEWMPDTQIQHAVQSAQEAAAHAPTLAAAAGRRIFSDFEHAQRFEQTPFRQPVGCLSDDATTLINELHHGLQAAALIVYAEGLAVLAAGSAQNGFGLNAAAILARWQSGCALRAPLLDGFANALRLTPDLANILGDDDVAEQIMAWQEPLRRTIACAHALGIATPTLTAALDYLDFSRDAWLPGNLIQVQPPRGLVSV